MFSPVGRYRALWNWYLTLPICLFLPAAGLFLCGVIQRPTLRGRLKAVKPSVITTIQWPSRRLIDEFYIKFTLESGEKIRIRLDSDSFDGAKNHYKPGDELLWPPYMTVPMVLSGADRRYQLCPMCGSLTLYTSEDGEDGKTHRIITCDGCGRDFICQTRAKEHDIGSFPNERPKLSP